MPKATRLGDNDTGHDACPPTALVTASANVIINGKGAGRVGDSYAPHGCSASDAQRRYRQRECQCLYQRQGCWQNRGQRKLWWECGGGEQRCNDWRLILCL